MSYLNTGACIKKNALIALKGLLGQYVLPNGQKVDAIAINPSMANLVFPPSGTSIIGLECHIYYPEVSGRSIISGINWDNRWTVYLKQWDLKQTTLLASERFVATCPFPIVNIFRNPSNLNINQPEICRIQINCYSVLY